MTVEIYDGHALVFRSGPLEITGLVVLINCAAHYVPPDDENRR